MKKARIFLFLAQVLFLWMFLSTQGLERMADAGLLSGPEPMQVKQLAYEYASRWRHGFTGPWPFYMPGFFAVSIAAWFWSFGRPLRKLIPEGAAIMLAALLAAALLSGYGAAIFLRDFERATGVVFRGAAPGPGVGGAAGGFYTLFAWCAVVLAVHRAVWWRSWKPLAVPLILEAVLLIVRPFTLGDLTTVWLHGAFSGDARAAGSLIAVPAVAAFLIWRQLAWERRHEAARVTAAQRG